MKGADGIQISQVRDNLHLNHGPIDLLLYAEGEPAEVRIAYENASQRFNTILSTLVDELPLLRRELSQGDTGEPLSGSIARNMYRACHPYRSDRLSPMAAVAGAVADSMLHSLNKHTSLRRSWVNNGGDIAFNLESGQRFCCGVVPELGSSKVEGSLNISEHDPVRGVATSGWATKGQGGRSFSFGIADAVTVLAEDAAKADVAATMIANHVDLPQHNGIERDMAIEHDPDSDLGERLITTGVPQLNDDECKQALEHGVAYARQLKALGLIHFAVLFLQKQFAVVGNDNYLQ